MPPSVSKRSTSFHVLPRESSGDGEQLSSFLDDRIISARGAHPRRRRRNKSRKSNLSQPSVDIGIGLGACLLEEDDGGRSTVSSPGGLMGSLVDQPFRQDSIGSQEWELMPSASRASDPIGVVSCTSDLLSSCSPVLSHNAEELANGSHYSHSNGVQAASRGQTQALGNQACMANGASQKVTQHSMEEKLFREEYQHSSVFVQSLSLEDDRNYQIAVAKSLQECIGIVETASSSPEGADYTTHQISSSRADEAHTTGLGTSSSSGSPKEDQVSPDVQVFIEEGSPGPASQLSRTELRQRITHTSANVFSQPVDNHANEERKDFGGSSISNVSECGMRTETTDSHVTGQGYQTPEKPTQVSAMHTETPHLLEWQQLMSENSLCSRAAITSPFDYFLGEVLRQPSTSQETQSAETAKKRQHVYNTMFHVPWRCELLIVVGFFVCLDSFLSLLTVMPIRIVVFLWRFVAKRRQFRRLRADELSDLGSLIVLMAGVTLLQQADISYIYHMIRSQATIKLYVVYNVLEIFDKLCQSFGSDVLQVVLNSAENVATCTKASLLSEAFQFAFDECIAIFSFVFHSFVILAQSITVSAAIRSHNNALLTLLISNNFAEIKSNVFKRLAKDNLHKLAYLDTVERFHIIAHLFFVLAQNLLAANEPWLHAFACNAGMVFLCEILVDVIKHAFLAKFNEIKPAAYSEFLLALCKQTLNSQSRELHKTMSFVPFAPACVVIRVLIPLYAAYLPGALLWRLLVMLFFGVLTYVFLIALKILVALGLLRHASWYVARHKKKEKLLHFD